MPERQLATLIEPWLADLAADHAPATITRYRSILTHFWAWLAAEEGGKLEDVCITPITLVTYRTALQQTAATSTVNTHVAALRTWFAWVHQHGHCGTNPAQRLRSIARTTPHRPQALSKTQIHALLQAAQRTRHAARDYAILQVLLQTGLRIGECATLCWDAITFGEKRGAVLIRAGKGMKARSVPLNTSARQALADYLAPLFGVAPTLRTVAAVWPHPADPQFHNPIWRSQKGGALSISALERMFTGLVTACAGCQCR